MKIYSGKFLASVLMTTAALTINHHLHAAEAGGMQMDHAGEHHEEGKMIHGMGVVQAINTAAGTVTLAHEAIPELSWPAMTMAFKMTGNAAEHVSVGQKVEFELNSEGTDATITKMDPAE